MKPIVMTAGNADAVRAQLTAALKGVPSQYLEGESVESVVGQIMEAVAPYVGKDGGTRFAEPKVTPKPEPEVAARSASGGRSASAVAIGTRTFCGHCGGDDIYVTSTRRLNDVLSEDDEEGDLFR